MSQQSPNSQDDNDRVDDLAFLIEIRDNLEKAFEERCVVAKDNALKMIDDWIDELTEAQH